VSEASHGRGEAIRDGMRKYVGPEAEAPLAIDVFVGGLPGTACAEMDRARPTTDQHLIIKPDEQYAVQAMQPLPAVKMIKYNQEPLQKSQL